MAKSFSIGRALSEAFGQYGRNWMMLTLAGAIVSSIWLLDYHHARNLNEARHFFKHELTQSANAQEAWDKTSTFVASYGYREDMPGNPIVAWIEVLLMLYLGLGLIRVCMGAFGKGKVNLQGFLTTPKDFLRYVGAIAVVVALMALFGIGLGAGFVVMRWFQLPISVMLLFAIALIFLMSVYVLHFYFIPYCIVDKSKSIMDTVSCSKKLIGDHLWAFLGFMIVFTMVLGLCKILLLLVLSPLTAIIPLEGIDYFLASSVVAPIAVMGTTSVYKQLK